MVNETLSTADLNKVQSAFDSLSRREKKDLLRLLKLQKILHSLNEEEKKELFALLNKGNDDECRANNYDYNEIRIFTSD